MIITWRGQSCFRLITSRGKDEQRAVVIDPYDKELGLGSIKLQADILLVSHQHHDHNNVKAVSGSPFLIDSPGEYEIKEIFIQGIPGFHDDSSGKERGKITIFTIEIEGIRICFLSDLGQKELSPEQLDEIGSIDILMIPIGGVYTISAKEAIKIISQIEPKIIIPMHYQIPKLKLKLEGLDEFLKAMVGAKTIEPQDKLSVRKKDLLEEKAKIIVLEP